MPSLEDGNSSAKHLSDCPLNIPFFLLPAQAEHRAFRSTSQAFISAAHPIMGNNGAQPKTGTLGTDSTSTKSGDPYTQKKKKRSLDLVHSNVRDTPLRNVNNKEKLSANQHTHINT
jgi:hypothetical protein